MAYRVELNADLGESWYSNVVGQDEELMPYLDACNVACGLHGGDALTIQRTLELAARHGVAVGAHPSFPDRAGFGRRVVDMSDERLYALLLYQVSALSGMAQAAGLYLAHLKPHGALYHFTDRQPAAAASVVRVMEKLSIPILYGPPGGALEAAARKADLEFYAEGFADRVYEPTLHLRPRQKEDATIDDPGAAAEQARMLALEGRVVASDGNRYPLQVRTLCLHGDHPGAVDRARAVRATLDAAWPAD